MKYFILVLTLLAYTSSQCQNNDLKIEDLNSSLASLNASGGSSKNEFGEFSFSIGQVFTNLNNSSNYNISEGVHQPEEIQMAELLPDPEPSIEISSFPNPVDDYFFIENNSPKIKNLTYQLFDLYGKLMQSGKLQQSTTRINGTRLRSAMYVVNVMEEGRHLKTLKIIKR
ncbi:T9SS type A sorting domain-containing protein [Christiangramia sp. LLG6405-1]|uniref:T9SS type A sorting domain-containing protein n=1 Tax=Christiangramia sp. LLG6405-1 TaxID=3160832 RepID=UPI00386593F4